MTALANFSEQASEILRSTSDGDDLAAADLVLVQDVVNTAGACLSERGRVFWSNLHRHAVSGQYARMREHFCGVPGLTRSHSGYVSWRGVCVEHYSHTDYDKMVEDARALGAICMELEARGEAVTGQSVMRVYDELRFGEGLSSPRHHLVWTLEPSGPRISLRSIESTAHIAAWVECKDHQSEALSAWGLPANSGRSISLITREDYDNLVQSLSSDARWAQVHRWAPYSSGEAVSAVLAVVHKVVSREDFPSCADLQNQLLGVRLAEVTSISETNLLRAENALNEEPVRERMGA